MLCAATTPSADFDSTRTSFAPSPPRPRCAWRRLPRFGLQEADSYGTASGTPHRLRSGTTPHRLRVQAGTSAGGKNWGQRSDVPTDVLIDSSLPLHSVLKPSGAERLQRNPLLV